MSTERPLISIVDDDETAREGTVDLVKSMGFKAKAFPSADDFLRSDAVKGTCCLITDMRMPGMTGLELYQHLIDSGTGIPTIVVTAFPDDRDRARALRAGVTCYMAKPFDDETLLECVQSALDSHGAR